MMREESAAAFESRIRENEVDLSRYLQRRLLNDADAADAFGEFLLTAWKARRKCPADPADARTWLFVVARNVLLNTRRSLARRSAATQRFRDAVSHSPGPDPADDDALDVARAIATLAPDDAELVRLVYWDGLRSHEAAAVLRITPSTARSRLARARERLRAVLEPESAALDA